MRLVLFLLFSLALAACATTQTAPGSTISLAQFTHADFQSAALYAEGNGFPQRAAVYRAIDSQLAACLGALEKAKPKAPALGATVGAFTAFEVAAEAVGQAIPANVKILCAPITLPSVLLLPIK